MNAKNYSRNEFEKKLEGNSLKKLLDGKEDIFGALLTWNKRWINFLLQDTIWEQCRIINMKVEHIIGLGEWLETVNFVKLITLEERVVKKVEEFQQELDDLIILFENLYIEKINLGDELFIEEFKDKLINYIEKINQLHTKYYRLISLVLSYGNQLIGLEGTFLMLVIDVQKINLNGNLLNCKELEEVFSYTTLNIIRTWSKFILPRIIEKIENGGFSKDELRKSIL
nr:hypothetical protein [Candidatus Gracilibacteria bacterium]